MLSRPVLSPAAEDATEERHEVQDAAFKAISEPQKPNQPHSEVTTDV
jgi:hypothetical protein